MATAQKTNQRGFAVSPHSKKVLGSVWSLHVPVPAWALSRYSGFLPKVQKHVIWFSELPIGALGGTQCLSVSVSPVLDFTRSLAQFKMGLTLTFDPVRTSGMENMHSLFS